MKSIKEFRQAYLDTDAFFAEKLATAASARSKNIWQRRRAMNDQAYFTLIFAQLEGYINEQCQKLIIRRKSSRRWSEQRAWDTFNEKDMERIPFMTRVMLLTQKGHRDYTTIQTLYRQRNRFAHGGTYEQVNVASEAETMDDLAGRLRA